MTSNIFHLSLFRIASATLLLLGFVLIPFFLFGDALEARSIALTAGGREAVALAGGALLALDIVLPVPSSLLATAIGAALGPWLGTLVNAGGLTLGCAFGLLIGRAGSPLARRLLGGRLFAPFADGVARYGLVALVVCRAVPVLGEASVVALGAGRVPFGPALAASAAANLVLGAIYAFSGGTALGLWLAILVPASAGLAAWVWLRRR